MTFFLVFEKISNLPFLWIYKSVLTILVIIWQIINRESRKRKTRSYKLNVTEILVCLMKINLNEPPRNVGFWETVLPFAARDDWWGRSTASSLMLIETVHTEGRYCNMVCGRIMISTAETVVVKHVLYLQRWKTFKQMKGWMIRLLHIVNCARINTYLKQYYSIRDANENM